MTQESFPHRGPVGEEPLPVGGEGSEGPEQGLFVCLPAEELTLAGFAQDGRSDTMAPGALLATLVDAVVGEGGSGLAGLADDQLIGIISAARRMESRAAWTLLAALAELARRRPPTGEPTDDGEYGFSEFAADEVAAELHLTSQSAQEQIWYARQVAGQLPASFAALNAGTIHPVHLRIIQDETALLSDDDKARADALLAAAAESLTFGQLRSKAHRLVRKLDPDAARKRKEQAKQDAHVRRFREDSGNAGMEARELPPDEVLASWQHVEQRALDLRAAGMSGTLRELRVRAYLDLLQERDSRLAPVGPGTDEKGNGPGGSPDPGDGPGGTGGPGSGPGDGPGRTGPGGHPHHAGQGAGPSVAALVNILVSAETLLGLSAAPGEAAGYGLLDADDARDLVAAAARHPQTRWCVTAVTPDGTAAAHGCARGRHPPPGTATGPDPPPGTTTGPDPPPGSAVRDYLASLRVPMAPIACGHCDHDRAETGYQPSRALQHLVKVRNARCTAPGCGRPASRCDLDHTVAWDQGGLTCECDLAPLCRHHHRCKQSQGWKLEQPSPGVLRWSTPAGRTYTTTPTSYPL
jgi:muconolactone delta-isomerase